MESKQLGNNVISVEEIVFLKEGLAKLRRKMEAQSFDFGQSDIGKAFDLVLYNILYLGDGPYVIDPSKPVPEGFYMIPNDSLRWYGEADTPLAAEMNAFLAKNRTGGTNDGIA